VEVLVVLVPRWLLIVVLVVLVGLSGLAVVFAQQQHSAPRLVAHHVDFEVDPRSPGLEARFHAFQDESNGVTCYVLFTANPALECFQ